MQDGDATSASADAPARAPTPAGHDEGQDFNDMLQNEGATAAGSIADLVDAALAAPRPAGEGDEAPGDDEVAASASPRAWGFDVEAINEDHALVMWGGKAVVVREQPAGPIEDRLRVISIEAFNAWYANRFTEKQCEDGKVRVVTWARAWLSHRRRRQFDGIEFFPNPDGAAAASGYLNLWRGFGCGPSTEGSYSIFRDHMLNNVCGGDPALFDYVFGWFAHMLQRPRERIGTALVLRGRMGSGKTKVGEIVGSLIPAHYFQVDDARYIIGQFNAHMAACLLLQAEEAVWAGDKAAEGRLKGLITSERQMIEQKGIDSIRVQNYVRLLMTSNEDWVIPAGKDERRFCVLDVDPRCAQNHNYFREMDEQINRGGRERLLHDLLNFDLDRVNLRQIPQTRALYEQKLQSFDSVNAWWFSRLSDGAPVRGGDTWPAQITTDVLYADYVRATDEVGTKRKRDRATFGLKLAKLVPGLEKRRLRVETEQPGVSMRAWAYVLPPLQACREAFDGTMGQEAGWPDPAAPIEAERATTEAAGDEVPF